MGALRKTTCRQPVESALGAVIAAGYRREGYQVAVRVGSGVGLGRHETPGAI
jgi:hypothetical protein